MAQGTSAGHAMPKGIKRVEQGVYRSLDGAIEIRQTDKGWVAVVLEVPEGRSFAKGETLTEKPLKTRGDVVKLLDEQGLLPLEAPKPEKAAEPEKSEERPTVLDPTDASGAEGANGGIGERKRRPTRARKQPAKAAAKV